MKHFNCKVGKIGNGKSCVRKFGAKWRNEHDEQLVHFVKWYDMKVINNFFPKGEDLKEIKWMNETNFV